MKRLDVVVIGAGVAGLAAARRLHRHGLSVAVYEARNRIGGRILSARESRTGLPVELGAEFIHGEAPETARLLEEADRPACDIHGDHWLARRGRLRRVDFSKQIDRVLKKIDPDGPDESMASFLARRPGGSSLSRDRAAAREFAQGFFAADLNELSALFIAPEEGEPPSEMAAQLSRVTGGYDTVPATLARDIKSLIHLNSPVTEIAWERGGVEVTYRGPGPAGQRPLRSAARTAARAAVITVPLGVLQAPPGSAGSIVFRPDPAAIRKSLDQMSMGSVVRVTFLFREYPWRDRGSGREDLRRLAFLHTRGGPFNIWWTAYPISAPLAVAWSGGPPAAELARRPCEEIESAAIRSLAEHLGTTPRRVASLVERSWFHNWDRDPFSRGAYSYARVGGSEAPKHLARPVGATLFFAGEAADSTGGSGTVEGAIASGLAAAKRVMRSFGAR